VSKKKIAILIDWENLRNEIAKLQKKNIISKEDLNYNDVEQIYNLITSEFPNNEFDIYRIFFYTALPLEIDKIKELVSKRHDIDFDKYKEFYYKNNIYRIIEKSKEFFKKLDKKDYIALRFGNLQIQTQKSDGNLVFNQKKVDMLIGLDTAHLSYNKIVDEIIFFCKDKDLSPAFKLARINGLNVSIVDIGGINISEHIYRHIDKIYKINIKQFSKIF
jgi:uncharacterized LabA/DUF88 family protein